MPPQGGRLHLSFVLPGVDVVRYECQVALALRTLDVYVIFPQSDKLIEKFRAELAVPLGHKSDNPDDIVHEQVLPADLRTTKHFLFFHVDRDTRKDTRARLTTAHLRYRMRPSGPAPKETRDLRTRGRTVEWVERTLTGLDDVAILLVEAEIHLSQWARHRAALATPSLQVGEASLKHCGEEYRASSSSIGEVSGFRWVEREPGTFDAWLTYSYVLKNKAENFWGLEERRCEKYLEQLV